MSIHSNLLKKILKMEENLYLIVGFVTSLLWVIFLLGGENWA